MSASELSETQEQGEATTVAPDWLKPASTATAYAIDYMADAAGKHIKASKRRVLFRFGYSNDGRSAVLEQEHVVTLSWSPTSGKAILAADGREVHLTDTSTGSKRRFPKPIAGKFEHSWEMGDDGEHALRIVACARSATSPRKKRQFDLFIDGVSFHDLPKCDKEGRIIGFEPAEVTEGGGGEKNIGSHEQTGKSKSEVGKAISQLEVKELNLLLDKIEAKRRGLKGSAKAAASEDNNVKKIPSEEAPSVEGNEAGITSSMAILPDEETEMIQHETAVAEDELEQLQNRLSDLSYLPFLEMVSKEETDLMKRGGAIADGEIGRLKMRVAELEEALSNADAGAVAENSFDSASAERELETLRSRIASLEKLVVDTDGEAAASRNNSDIIASEDSYDESATATNASETGGGVSYLSFLEMMGETETELMKRDKAIAEEKANRLKNLISNLETLVDDDGDLAS